MECRKCHKTITDESRFCMYCGSEQTIRIASKNRGSGQGTAIKRGNTWTAVWTEETYIGEDGKLKQRRKTRGGFKTKTAALAFAASPHQEKPKAPTLRAYWTGYKTSDFLDLSKSKQTAYTIAWRRLESLAGRKIDEVGITDLQRCIDATTSTYYPARDMKAVLSHLYKRAVAEGHARTNLAEYIRLPKLAEKEIEPFTADDLIKLWDAYGSGDSFVGFILLMIYSGMMPGELFGLKKDMIDWTAHEITGCGLKTKKRKETPIIFPTMIEPVLRDLVERSKSSVKNVLCMNRDTFYFEYHDALKRVGISDRTPYSCRHTTATALALGNIAPSVIQEVMRHTKFATTQRYIHPTNESAHAAVDAMDKGVKASQICKL